MILTTIRRRDVFNPRWRFRSVLTGARISRLRALLHPATTVKERVL